MASEEKIVLKAVTKPSRDDVDELTNWFCKVFGLGEKELEPAMLKEIIENTTGGSGTTSKDLNRKLDVPRTTVIYHLNRFIYSGIVVRKGRRYYLRSEDMESTIEELQADMEREFGRMMEFAQKMDELIESDMHGRRRTRKR
jgi:predicted transcriptional regulator